MLVGIAINRASRLDDTYTTIHLAEAALRLGHRVRFVEPWDWEVNEQGDVICRAHCFDKRLSVNKIVDQLRNRTAKRRYVAVRTLDVLLLRASPMDPTVHTFALLARDRGVAVVNDPVGAQRVSDKAWLASIQGVSTPRTVVTRSRGVAHMFFMQQDGPVVIKPSRGAGGRLVQKVEARDETGFDEAFDVVTHGGSYALVQAYVEAPDAAEKRLVWLDGSVIGAYRRVRAPGNFRHNLKQGATPEATEVADWEHALIAPLSPHLLEVGVRLAGIDLIGDAVIEVNALNPGGAFHAGRLAGTKLSDQIIARLEMNTTHGIPPHADQETGRGPRK